MDGFLALQRIKGIGPKYAQLLKEVGITTVVQLAGRDSREVWELLGCPKLAKPELWVQQAKSMCAPTAPAPVQPYEHRDGLYPHLPKGWRYVPPPSGSMADVLPATDGTCVEFRQIKQIH